MGLSSSRPSLPSIQSLHYSILLNQKVFTTQTLIITVGGFIIGYQIGELYDQIKNNKFNTEQTVSHLCPICQQNPFIYIHKECRHILACENCYQKMDAKCRLCRNLITVNSVQKVFF